jgi:hypothetical protein
MSYDRRPMSPLFPILLISSAGLAHWQDGKAEIASYDLIQPRYGELRKGVAVMIFVTEPFSEELRVKADPGHDPSDVFPAFKLNYVKDFPTGVYDYNLMTSVFVSLEERQQTKRAGAPVKIAFSAQEWCGMLFDELLFHPDRIDRQRFSYFGSEADAQEKLTHPPGAITVDELPILVRAIPRAILREGETRKLSVLPSLERARLLHRPLRFVQGTLSRAKGTRVVSVPSGKFEVEDWTLEAEGERYAYAVERAFPHRIIEWTGPEGESGKLRGVDRIEYWKLNRNGDEAHLRRIGL